MKRNHLNIESTEDFKALENYFNSLREPDGLMLLIRNPQFEFDLNLSSRMLNYHESNGFIRFHREGQAGKRRFSLVNAIGFQFSLYLKRIGLSNDEISDLNELLNSKDENGISDWDLVVYLGALAIGQFEVWLRKESNPIPINENKIKVESNGENDDFQLSNELRGTFFNGQGNILLRGKSASFLPNLIYQENSYSTRAFNSLTNSFSFNQSVLNNSLLVNANTNGLGIKFKDMYTMSYDSVRKFQGTIQDKIKSIEEIF